MNSANDNSLVAELVDVADEQRAAMVELFKRIDGDNPGAIGEVQRLLLHTIKAQHQVLDVLLALALMQDASFRPSQCGVPWQAVQHGFAVIRRYAQ